MQPPTEFYRDLFEAAPIPYFSVAAEGHIRAANRAARELLGVTRGSLVGRHVLDLYAQTSAGRQRAETLFERFRAGDSVEGEELEMQRADGSSAWVRLWVRPVRDAAGRVIGSRSEVVDITERRRAERRYEHILGSAPDAMLVVDPRGRIAEANPAAEALFGYRRDELLGLEVERLIPEEARKQYRDHRRRYEADPRSRPMGTGLELSALRQDGSTVPVDVSLSPMSEDDGLQVIAAVRDVTELRRHEAARQELADWHQRRRDAIWINDNVIQGLAVAQWSFQMGDDERGRRLVEETLTTAQALVRTLAGAGGMLEPGDLTREEVEESAGDEG